MGGSWISLFINYVKLDFYFCEDKIDYDAKNPKCTTQQKIKEEIGYNNSLEIEFYYPVVQFQQTNITNPIIVLYKQHFYHISNYSNKIDRLFLQEYLFEDNLGWFKNEKINYSFWGFSELSGDSYVTINKRDLMNEGST